jgi:hypothetical protein
MRLNLSKTTYLVFVIVLTVMVLSVTVFKGDKGSATTQQNVRTPKPTYQDRTDRYPVAEYDEAEPIDSVKRAKLKHQKQRFDKDAPFFTQPGPEDEEIAFRPEWQFDFPGLPIAKSDAIVVGRVLSAEAHRSHNKRNVFSNFQVAALEVLKGGLPLGSEITVQRVGGFVKFPNGRKVLFRLSGNGMPATAGRYVFFLKVIEEDYSILTAYELAADGVVPLDNSQQFQVYQGLQEHEFLKTLRDSLSRPIPQ